MKNTAEELIAELGATILCAHLGVQGQLSHAEYIASRLSLLKEDHRTIFTSLLHRKGTPQQTICTRSPERRKRCLSNYHPI
jgi:antirestriction protein ArdC